MIFIEFEFIVFLVVIFIIHHFLPEKHRWLNLLFSSFTIIGFTSLNALIYASVFTLINYGLGIWQSNLKEANHKRLLLISAVTLNVSYLLLFKYINLMLESVFGIVSIFSAEALDSPVLKIIAPVGISFYTFSAISYQLDLKRGHFQCEKNILRFLFFILYFPKFISGPVERAKTLLPQIYQPIKISSENTISGAKLFFWGLFKKLVIADQIVGLINDSYLNVGDYSGIYLFFILLVQPIQIYCDFSGYTDIARGLSRIFGVELLNNFDKPFMATNITNFWKRWHMSLTNWCGDYIYKHIVFKRRKWKNWAAVYAVMLTFIIIGVWHGPRWTYIVLGAMQGIAMSYEFFTKRWRIKKTSKMPVGLNNLISRILVYLFFGFSLIFLFAPDMNIALEFLSNMFAKSNGFSINWHLVSQVNLFVALILFFAILYIEFRKEKRSDIDLWLLGKPIYYRWGVYLVLLLVLVSFGNFGNSDFVYAGF